jgi:hypothetical protein
LHRPLVTIGPAAEHERDVGIVAEVANLARRLERVEHQLETVGHGDTDDSGLNSIVAGAGRLDGEPLCAHEREQRRRRHPE